MVIWVAITIALIAALFVALFRGMISRPDVMNDAAGWLETFSLEAYAPMKRLLDEQDFVFLAALPGYEPSIERALRRERKAVYLAYLRRLAADFQQLFAIAKIMVVYGSEDRSGFASSLWRQQVTFYSALFMLRVRLVFYPILAGKGDLQSIFQPLQVLQSGIRQHALQA